MTVHALIPVFNRLDMTRRALADLRAQRDVDLRIVVIDDGSTDGTSEYLAAQPDVALIRGDGNLWWAGAIDAALRQVVPAARPDDYVLFLNNDVGLDADYVSRLQRASAENGGAIIGSAIRERAAPHRLVSIGPRMATRHMRIWDALDELSEEERAHPKPLYAVDALSGRGTLYPIAVLRRVGFLHPKLLPHYHADYELAARARRHGFSTIISTEAVVYTDGDFGVHRKAASPRQRLFGKGSPNNVLQRVAFRLLVGTPYERVTAIPRMALGLLVRAIPARVRFALALARDLFRYPYSGQARARVLHFFHYLSMKSGGTSYNALHASRAGLHKDVLGGRVLVVGCNTGKDCAHFVRLGASAVHGLDVIPEVGSDYQHRSVAYLRGSVERIGVADQTYDLAFCFATMEHVPDIDKAFREMARVIRPGGVIYSVASPLWNSRYGHHKGDLFERHPWIHLRLDEAQIRELSEREGIADPTGRHSMAVHIRYMLDGRYFNKVQAQRYLDTCSRLEDVEVLDNSLASDPDDVLPAEICAELATKGYSRKELLAVTHTFIGRKRARAASR